MPYAGSKGVRIHYKVDGTGPPLVLLHGLSLDHRMWEYVGYVQALKDDYRLVLINARGHGASDKPHTPEAYRMESRVNDVVAVLDDLGIGKAHYFGYSMGGRIGWGTAKYAPARFHSLIIGGAHPYEMDPDTTSSSLRLFAGGSDAVVAAFERAFGGALPPEWQAMAMGSDPDALVALLTWRLRERASYEEILPAVTVPCLLVVGEHADEFHLVRECASRMPSATLVAVPGFGHEVVFHSDVMVPHILAFLQTARRNTP